MTYIYYILLKFAIICYFSVRITFCPDKTKQTNIGQSLKIKRYALCIHSLYSHVYQLLALYGTALDLFVRTSPQLWKRHILPEHHLSNANAISSFGDGTCFLHQIKTSTWITVSVLVLF